MKISLNGLWKYRCDADHKGERENWHGPNISWENFYSCELPCCWNSIKEDQVLQYDRYEGYFWFFKKFELNIDTKKDYLLEFKGVNYYCKIWLNGAFLGSHSGGFVPFFLKIPVKILEPMNSLVIEVENFRKFERIPSSYFDWYNWGGIYRDINLLVVPKTRIRWIHITTKKIFPDSAQLNISYSLTQEDQLQWKILRNNYVILEGKTTNPQNLGEFLVDLTSPELWTPEFPNLYAFEAQIMGDSEVIERRFGIRTIEVKNKAIYLNNQQIKLRGVSLHEEFMPFGRAQTKEHRVQDIKNIKKLGFNTVRTAHYSHDESLMNAADELGILIFEEIPVYWLCDYKNPETLKTAAKQLKSLIYRDFNHPSVILWSVGNEVPVEKRSCYQFILQLMRLAKKLDPSRIVTYVSNRMFSDKLHMKSDLACINLYFGWYLASERNLNLLLDIIHETDSTHPWIITEFGAGAQYGFHSAQYQKFSEEKQASIISHSIETFNSKDYVAGWIIWIYRDFRSALRTNQYQQGFNRKGLVSDKNEPKLIAKVIHYVLNKITKKRRFRIMPKYYFFLKPVEILIFGFLFDIFQELYNKKLFEKFYSRKSLKEI